jgi:tetratricopeptide (TPR) repeat protein
MKSLLLSAAAFAVMGMSQSSLPTGASTVTVGGSAAESCYEAALSRDASAGAMADCNAAIEREATPFNDIVATYVNRGVLKLVLADYHSAEADFDQAMRLEPTQPEAWLNKGIARYQLNDPQAAAVLFGRAIEYRTRYASLAHYGRALAYEDTGNIRGAYQELRRATALNPGWAAPRTELARFQVTRN